MNYVAYYRVSTEDQGKSGLGLSAQQENVLDFIKHNGVLVGEFQDIESGASESRQGILKAIKSCKEHNATIVVKSLTRITREGYGIQDLLNKEGVNYIESSAPFDPEIVKAIKLELSKEEVRKIRNNTKDALDQIKKTIKNKGFYITKEGKKITKLGSPKVNLTEEGRLKSIQTRSKKAKENPNNIKASALILLLKDNEKLSYNKIAGVLNEKGFLTSRGKEFTRVQVQRLYIKHKDWS